MSGPTVSDIIYCHECDRGGNGNAKDKCACGWRIDKPSVLGCFAGTPIVGEIIPKQKEKTTPSKERYKRFREYGDGFESFLSYCYWDASPERLWNSVKRENRS